MNDLNGWEEKSFVGNTDYKIKTFEGVERLYANSQASASGLFKEITINLRDTPYLSWQWLVNNKLMGLNEKSKEGDDYAVRIYVVAKHPIFFWKTRALNYVFSSNQDVDSVWPNAYTSQAMMIAVNGKDDATNEWHQHKRNVYEDFKRYFGEEVTQIDAIAVMTDTDNGKQQATAWDGDLTFSSD